MPLKLLFALSFISLLSYPAPAQSAATSASLAQVTFYSSAFTMTGGLPGHKPGAFRGKLFDGDHQLAFIEPGRFVTFALPVGTHVFAATYWYTKHAKDGAHVTLNLVAGEHYFLEALVLSNYVSAQHISVGSVTCEGAAGDNIRAKPLEPEHIQPDAVPIAIVETSFPICPE